MTVLYLSVGLLLLGGCILSVNGPPSGRENKTDTIAHGVGAGLILAGIISLLTYVLSLTPPPKGSVIDKSEPKVVKTVSN
jgi:hypothetical protein